MAAVSLKMALLLLFAGSGWGADLYWFQVPSETTNGAGEQRIPYSGMRGCYRNSCYFVSVRGVLEDEVELAPYRRVETWVRGFSNGTEALLFGAPGEVGQGVDFLVELPERVVASHFDPTPYIAGQKNPEVQRFVDSISKDRLQAGVYELSDKFFTRNSQSQEAVQAADYLSDTLRDLGCDGVHQRRFLSGYSANVVCSVQGHSFPHEVVALGAHYDDRAGGSGNTTSRAPGADDNGTGVSALLELLRVAKSGKFRFERTLMFLLFSGEEQGLRGSKALAKELVANKTIELTAFVNMDMIGYAQPKEPDTLWWKKDKASESLTNLAIDLTKQYLGDIVVKKSTGCCSDYISFHDLGVPAAGACESNSASNNPNYHRSTDLPDSVQYEHMFKTTQSTASLFATLAKPL